MECYEVQEWCSSFMDGEVEDERRQRIRDHLDGCPSCAEAYRLLLEVKQLVRQKAPREEAPAHLREKVLAALEEEKARRRSASRETAFRRALRRSLPAVAAAAVVLLLLGIVAHRLVEAPQARLAEGFLRAHLQYEMARPLLEEPGSDTRRVSARLRGQVDFPLQVPDLGELELTLVGGRALSVGGQKVAHLLYAARSGHTVSLFVLAGDEIRLPLEKVQQGRTTYQVGGYKEMAFVSWRERRLGYLLICQGQERVRGLMRCALLVQNRVGLDR